MSCSKENILYTNIRLQKCILFENERERGLWQPKVVEHRNKRGLRWYEKLY